MPSYQTLRNAADTQRYGNTYSSLSGVDIKPVLAGIAFGNVQAISYSITREKAPIFSCGSPEPRGFARGKRGIAGSMIFVMMDCHALLTAMRAKADVKFISDKDEIRPEVSTIDMENLEQDVTTKSVNENRELPASSLEEGWESVSPWYVDQIPPFNTILTGVDELGHASVMVIYGKEILNEGYGVSIDDLISEQQFTYVARGVQPWTRVQVPDTWGDGPLSFATK